MTQSIKDLPQEVKDGLEIIHVRYVAYVIFQISADSMTRHIYDAMRYVWPDTHWPGEERFAVVESQL